MSTGLVTWESQENRRYQAQTQTQTQMQTQDQSHTAQNATMSDSWETVAPKKDSNKRGKVPSVGAASSGSALPSESVEDSNSGGNRTPRGKKGNGRMSGSSAASFSSTLSEIPDQAAIACSMSEQEASALLPELLNEFILSKCESNEHCRRSDFDGTARDALQRISFLQALQAIEHFAGSVSSRIQKRPAYLMGILRGQEQHWDKSRAAANIDGGSSKLLALPPQVLYTLAELCLRGNCLPSDFTPEVCLALHSLSGLLAVKAIHAFNSNKRIVAGCRGGVLNRPRFFQRLIHNVAEQNVTEDQGENNAASASQESSNLMQQNEVSEAASRTGSPNAANSPRKESYSDRKAAASNTSTTSGNPNRKKQVGRQQQEQPEESPRDEDFSANYEESRKHNAWAAPPGLQQQQQQQQQQQPQQQRQSHETASLAPTSVQGSSNLHGLPPRQLQPQHESGRYDEDENNNSNNNSSYYEADPSSTNAGAGASNRSGHMESDNSWAGANFGPIPSVPTTDHLELNLRDADTQRAGRHDPGAMQPQQAASGRYYDPLNAGRADFAQQLDASASTTPRQTHQTDWQKNHHFADPLARYIGHANNHHAHAQDDREWDNTRASPIGKAVDFTERRAASDGWQHPMDLVSPQDGVTSFNTFLPNIPDNTEDQQLVAQVNELSEKVASFATKERAMETEIHKLRKANHQLLEEKTSIQTKHRNLLASLRQLTELAEVMPTNASQHTPQSQSP